MTLLHPVNISLSFAASVLRLGAGSAPDRVLTDEPLVLYEFEGCPYCRIAREAVSETGVTVLMRPCPKGGERFRPKLKEIGGKAQFPYLIDPNTDVRMYESADIARYLRDTYGDRKRPLVHWLGPVGQILSQFAVLMRLMGGTFRSKSIAPAKALELYGSERSPATRIVKEKLCEMEIEYLWQPAPLAGGGIPQLIDPNTNETYTGALKIRRYLKATYGA
ncbi:glutathione S-transferase N-terminal domain-containing protein [Parvularcula sp. IMCC14364]|uniref:glutathione S-transferase N-terminal domain-containing protein n=1 Tax=Parvularcula sp. IMCC14364 TaxID=3067902 RepID=UPI002741D9D1|nr:glutathione S-transferase N-terminal domain-containing protein [Parvularcula sp. IMCC14364]